MMISARARGIAKTRAILRDEFGAERVEPRIANRRRRRDDEFPVRRLPGAQFGRALQELRLLLHGQRPRLPLTRVEAILLVLIKFAGDLDEVAVLHRVAGL